MIDAMLRTMPIAARMGLFRTAAPRDRLKHRD